MTAQTEPKLSLTVQAPKGERKPMAIYVGLVKGTDPHNPASLTEPCVEMYPIPNPEVAKVLNRRGITRTGPYSWAFGKVAHPNGKPLWDLAAEVAHGLIVPRDRLRAGNNRSVINVAERHRSIDVVFASVAYELGIPAPSTEWYRQEDNNGRRNWGVYVPHDPVEHWGIVEVSASETQVYISFSTLFADNLYREYNPYDYKVGEDILDPAMQVRLNIRPVGKAPIDPKPVHPLMAFTAMAYLARRGVPIAYTPEVVELRKTASQSAVVYPTPGRPAKPLVVTGRQSETFKEIESKPLITPDEWGSPLVGASVVASEVDDLYRKHQSDKWAIDDQVTDIVSMSVAEPYDDSRLRDYQKQAVGIHLATKYGYVNALEPGMGKTICALVAMAARARDFAKRGDRYFGLVCCEANVRSQWVSEAKIWFPEAKLIKVDSRSRAADLAEALESHDGPVVAIISHSLAKTVVTDLDPTTVEEKSEEQVESNEAKPPKAAKKVQTLPLYFNERGQGLLFGSLTVGDEEVALASNIVEEDGEDEGIDEAVLGEVLMSVRWHDLIADEAAFLRNPGTRQTRGLWKLRQNSDLAVALTGTPVTRDGIDDLARLIAWTRNNAEMFSGANKLSKNFNVADDGELAEFTEAIGPLVFRRNKSDIVEELPQLEPEVVKLTPTPEERALAEAARSELREAFEQLVSYLEMAEAAAQNSDEYRQIREQLTQARGVCLGSTSLARLAASDPAALKMSESAGAKLLSGGLIDAAVENGGTKRKWAVQKALEYKAEGKQIVFFTEFATVGDLLVEDLKSAGVRVGKIMGGNIKRRDQDIADFQAGKLDVVVCTSAGKRGLNLQTASAVVHLDLPWTPDDVAQRTARVERIGATAENAKVYYVIMEGTIEERIVAILAARAATAVRALDISRGADASGTDMGRLLAALGDSVDVAELSEGQATLVEMTRILVAA